MVGLHEAIGFWASQVGCISGYRLVASLHLAILRGHQPAFASDASGELQGAIQSRKKMSE